MFTTPPVHKQRIDSIKISKPMKQILLHSHCCKKIWFIWKPKIPSQNLSQDKEKLKKTSYSIWNVMKMRWRNLKAFTTKYRQFADGSKGGILIRNEIGEIVKLEIFNRFALDNRTVKANSAQIARNSFFKDFIKRELVGWAQKTLRIHESQ